jgi:hypothetical protein
MIHKEAPNQIVTVAHALRQAAVACQQQARVLDAAGGEDIELRLDEKSVAADRCDRETLNLRPGLIDLNLCDIGTEINGNIADLIQLIPINGSEAGRRAVMVSP